jgi:hypothetical protein
MILKNWRMLRMSLMRLAFRRKREVRVAGGNMGKMAVRSLELSAGPSNLINIQLVSQSNRA